MLGLPPSTEIKRLLPKAQLYRQFALKPAQRDAFDADIARLDFVNRIAPQSLPAIAEGAEVKAVFVVAVALKRPDYDARNLALVARLIPHRILFVLHEGSLEKAGKVQLAVYHTKLFISPWMPLASARLPLEGLNLDAVWQNMVVFIGGMEIKAGNSLAEQIRIDGEQEKLARQIAFLERQMRATRQTRRQCELYAEIKKLKTQYHEETDHEEP